MSVDKDAHWKYLIQSWFQDFVKFFLPSIYEEVDFTVPPIFLEKELDKINKGASKKGHKRCDKLVKVTKKDGTEQWLLIHIEVQDGYDKLFAKRMFIYYVRIFDLYDEDIAAIAIFTGDRLPPKPINQYHRKVGNTNLTYEYETYVVKQLNTLTDEEALLANDNPFAVVILACLYVLKTKVKDYEKNTTKEQIKQKERLKFKLKLLELAKERGYTNDMIFSLLNFIKYVVKLPEELEIVATKKYYELQNKNTMTKEFMEQKQAFFDKYFRANAIEIIKELERRKVIEEFEAKRLQEKQELEAKRLQEKTISIIHLYTKSNFTVHQIAVVLQMEENEIIAILKKENLYKQ